jgi:hypothetical protein
VVDGEPPKDPGCDDCLVGKMSRYPFRASENRAHSSFDRIHADLCGPFRTRSVIGHHRYFLSLIDECTRYHWLYFLTKKSEAMGRIKKSSVNTTNASKAFGRTVVVSLRMGSLPRGMMSLVSTTNSRYPNIHNKTVWPSALTVRCVIGPEACSFGPGFQHSSGSMR